MSIRDILQGHTNELLGLNTNISDKRMVICNQCPLKINKLGGTCDSSHWLNPKTGDVSDKPRYGYINGCECRLKAKTRLADAVCPVGKW